MIKLPPFDLYAGNTADRNSTNFPKRGNALAYVDTEAGALHVHVAGSWVALGGGIPEPDDDAETYGRMTDTGVSSWVAVVPKSGGNFTGTITSDGDIGAGDGTGAHQVYVNGAAGQVRDFRMLTNGAPRWIIAANTTAESGSNAGSNLEILARDDTGSALSTPIAITRSTGLVTLSTGAVINGGVVFNEPGAAVSHRIEGDTDANLTVWDGVNDRVGIGRSSPQTKLDVSGVVRVTSDTYAAFQSKAHLDNNSGGQFLADKSRGTESSPSNVQNGDYMFQFLARACWGSGYRDSAAIELKVAASGTLSSTSMPGQIDLKTSPDGSTALSTRMTILNGILIGSPSGGDKGAGTANAQAAYYVAGTQVVSTRKTGWGAATGTPTRTTFATGTVTTAQLAERVKALIDDLASHGLIGA